MSLFSLDVGQVVQGVGMVGVHVQSSVIALLSVSHLITKVQWGTLQHHYVIATHRKFHVILTIKSRTKLSCLAEDTMTKMLSRLLSI